MTVPIADGNFSTCSAGAAPDSCPKHFEWAHVPGDQPARFYTDWCMKYALGKSHHPKIAWLIQAPPFAQEHYDFALAHEDEFDYILTYTTRYAGRNSKWLWYPLGGTRTPLTEWYVHHKSGLVSMLASNKNDATGHKLRHAVYDRFGYRIQTYGSIVDGVEVPKSRAIWPFMYSIVICGERNEGGFSDHLLDALAVGTVPIYWGCPDIGKYFDLGGIIPFESPDDLPDILDSLTLYDYMRRWDAINANLDTARQYRVPEDWLWENLPQLFEGVS